MGKKREVPTDETPQPVEPQEDPQPAETTTEPETTTDESGEETPVAPIAEVEPGPLTKLQTAVRELLDYDQIAEIRLALSSREAELEKHTKKGNDLGVREEDARRRLRLIVGSDTRFGLTRIFAPEELTETRDLFFDREKENGRPDGDEKGDETITFRTVDGRDVTCLRDHLWVHALDLAALFTAGTLSAELEKEIKDQDFWAEIAGELETAGVAE